MVLALVLVFAPDCHLIIQFSVIFHFFTLMSILTIINCIVIHEDVIVFNAD